MLIIAVEYKTLRKIKQYDLNDEEQSAQFNKDILTPSELCYMEHSTFIRESTKQAEAFAELAKARVKPQLKVLQHGS